MGFVLIDRSGSAALSFGLRVSTAYRANVGMYRVLSALKAENRDEIRSRWPNIIKLGEQWMHVAEQRLEESIIKYSGARIHPTTLCLVQSTDYSGAISMAMMSLVSIP